MHLRLCNCITQYLQYCYCSAWCDNVAINIVGKLLLGPHSVSGRSNLHRAQTWWQLFPSLCWLPFHTNVHHKRWAPKAKIPKSKDRQLEVRTQWAPNLPVHICIECSKKSLKGWHVWYLSFPFAQARFSDSKFYTQKYCFGIIVAFVLKLVMDLRCISSSSNPVIFYLRSYIRCTYFV